MATLAVVLILADEHSAVAPLISALAMHHIVLPVAEEEPVVMPDKKTFPIEHIIAPFSDISILVGPAIFSLALLGGIQVEALVLAAVVPLFFSEAMLLILVPVPHILGAVGMAIDAEALRHIVNKLALIEISTGMVELSAAVIKI
jgi:hypothetical protein